MARLCGASSVGADDAEKKALLEVAEATKTAPDAAAAELARKLEAEAARRAYACRVVLLGLLALFGVMFTMKAVTESPDQRRTFSSACMHALGGGVVGPRGSLLHFDPRCTQELKEYFDQAYFSEVRRVADQAVAHFKQQVARQRAAEAAEGRDPPPSRGTVVFDIDETALSNMDGFFGPSAWQRLLSGVGLAAGTGEVCARPHLEFNDLTPQLLQLRAATALAGREPGLPDGDLAEEGPSGGYLPGAAGLATMTVLERRPLCSAPPLRATLDLYNWLYDNNYTVVFLTGRSEDARADTAANLLDAGYGSRCGDTPDPAASASAATAPVRVDRSALSSRRALGDDSSSSASGSGSAPAPPPASKRCYAELLMRVVGDDRLASVFKAEARRGLIAAGHDLVGNIGDQFSDLVGEASAPASFKLPNPVYTLL
ncbi:hypothetical protein HYH03_000275 [Edaphochlamys debaryana]|uniref:Acid phosphatase n=1 Tax=Edaphochlamys debaryana TaxID=47281 RepID=A0A836C6C5_9CHLO|nr:hypothetical protein HYH03_000275 [Edaphochlamys debaryana]|eukprot:KAG2501775.1 hypothetical protein HYH03_000275 [Edaphochlamys debaryana]